MVMLGCGGSTALNGGQPESAITGSFVECRCRKCNNFEGSSPSQHRCNFRNSEAAKPPPFTVVLPVLLALHHRVEGFGKPLQKTGNDGKNGFANAAIGQQVSLTSGRLREKQPPIFPPSNAIR
jgi:hypothetical protein